MQANILIVIPARGGSKGIPRKNLRPLGGKPLISYAIATARSSCFAPTVCVSSEDEEICSVSRHYGAAVVRRPVELSGDGVTLDPVIHHAYKTMARKVGHDFDLVVTMQPTSPLLTVGSLDAAIRLILENESIDTVISAREDTHLSWRLEAGRYRPNFAKRVNRAELIPNYRETGGFFVSRASVVTPGNRIGENVHLFALTGRETIDIDTFEDWWLCVYYLRRKRILFFVAGNDEVGLGHVYNTLSIAHGILDHDLMFLVDAASGLALEKISESNYPVVMQQREDVLEDIRELRPDVVVNDRLDTDAESIRGMKALGCKVVNFEDLGDGAGQADLVINAIYPERESHANHFFGSRYFILRDEFLQTPRKEVQRTVAEVLITFGGVDRGDYTRRVIDEILEFCKVRGIAITVIAGFGYQRYHELSGLRGVRVLRNVKNIAEHMARADIVFTSAGRTVYEVASIGTPAIVLAQNERELTHFFASTEHGFLALGLGSRVPSGKIAEAFVQLVDDFERRKTMSRLMGAGEIREARQNVLKLIYGLLEE